MTLQWSPAFLPPYLSRHTMSTFYITDCNAACTFLHINVVSELWKTTVVQSPDDPFFSICIGNKFECFICNNKLVFYISSTEDFSSRTRLHTETIFMSQDCILTFSQVWNVQLQHFKTTHFHAKAMIAHTPTH